MKTLLLLRNKVVNKYENITSISKLPVKSTDINAAGKPAITINIAFLNT